MGSVRDEAGTAHRTGGEAPAVALANRRWLYASRAVRSFSTAFLTVVFPLYLASQGYSGTSIGLVLTVGGFLSAALVLAVGLGGDRFGRRRMLLWVAGLGAAGGAALAVSANLAVVMVANGLCGVGRGGGAGSGGAWGPVFPAEQPLLAASASPRSRTAAFGVMSTVGVAAGALGSLVAWVPDVLHRSGWSWGASYRLVFVLGAILSVALLAVVARIREQRPVPAAGGTGGGPVPGGPRLSSRQLLARLGSVNALNGFGFGFLGPLLTYWFHVRYGVGPGEVGVLYTVINLLTMLPYLGAGRVAGRLGAVRTVVWTRTVGLAFLLAMIWTPTFPLAGAAYALRMAANSLGMPARQSYIMGVADERRRSTVAAVGALPSQISSSVSPVVGGALMTAFLEVPIVGAVLFMGANTVGFYLSFRRYRPPEESGGALSCVRDVPAQQEAARFEHVRQRQRPAGGGFRRALRARGSRQGRRRASRAEAGSDPSRTGPRQHRGHGQAELVKEPGAGELAEQVRPALGEDPPVPAARQGGQRGRQVDGIPPGDDHVGVLRRGGPPVCGSQLRGDHDRAGIRRRGGEQRRVGVQAEPPGDHGDRRRGRPPGPQLRPYLVLPGRLVALGARRLRAHQNHVGEAAQDREHLPVRGTGQPAGPAPQRRGAVRAGHHVRAQPRRAVPPRLFAAVPAGGSRVGVEPGELIGGQAPRRAAGAHREDLPHLRFTRGCRRHGCHLHWDVGLLRR